MKHPVNPEEFAIASVNGLSLNLDVDDHIDKSMEVYQAAYDKAVEFNKEHGSDKESNSNAISDSDRNNFLKMNRPPKY